LVHLVGFITDKFVTMHGHTNVKKGELLLTSVTSKDEEKYKVKLCQLINLNLSIVKLLKPINAGFL